MARTQTYAALLRGVNVGGRKVPMADLARVAAALGHENVRTYIQSGNMLLTSGKAARAVAGGLEAAIAARFGFDVAVILRTPAELRAVAAGNPFDGAGAAARQLHVAFFESRPSAAAIAKLDPARSPGDEIRFAGRDAYLHLPHGAGQTKLTLGYLERVLGVRGTQRNWNTLLKLIELSERATGS